MMLGFGSAGTVALAALLCTGRGTSFAWQARGSMSTGIRSGRGMHTLACPQISTTAPLTMNVDDSAKGSVPRVLAYRSSLVSSGVAITVAGLSAIASSDYSSGLPMSTVISVENGAGSAALVATAFALVATPKCPTINLPVLGWPVAGVCSRKSLDVKIAFVVRHRNPHMLRCSV